MKIFKKAGQPQLTKIQKRVASLSTPELTSWVENSLFVIGKEITHHQKTRNIEALYEMELGAEALLAIVQELKKRAEYELR
jgi:hypothetical protein